jgi:hypothetical protein
MYIKNGFLKQKTPFMESFYDGGRGSPDLLAGRGG